MKFPGTPDIRRMRIWGADEALCLNPPIYGSGKAAVFDKADLLTGKIRKSLPFSGFLDTAGFHLENAPIFTYLFEFLDIDLSIKPEGDGLDKGWNSSSFFHFEPFANPFGLHFGELFPGLFIQFDGCAKAKLLLDSTEPEAIMSQPVPVSYTHLTLPTKRIV